MTSMKRNAAGILATDTKMYALSTLNESLTHGNNGTRKFNEEGYQTAHAADYVALTPNQLVFA
jgi:hypothetical protein